MTLQFLPPPEVNTFDFDSDIRDGIRPPFFEEVAMHIANYLNFMLHD